MKPNLICVDLGNTTVHCGLFAQDEIVAEKSFPTDLFLREPEALANLIEEISPPLERSWDASYCSVVPDANEGLEKILGDRAGQVFGLTSSTCRELPISHPTPSEIGADRLANAIAVQVHHATPAIVIDLGTATTFDIVGTESGYEGGIIAPGLALMTEYLAERTALLPKLDPSLAIPESLVGRSSREAMQIGCSLGFCSMTLGIAERIRAQVASREGKDPVVILTGGTAQELALSLNVKWPVDPSLTLKGLREAYRRDQRGH